MGAATSLRRCHLHALTPGALCSAQALPAARSAEDGECGQCSRSRVESSRSCSGDPPALACAPSHSCGARAPPGPGPPHALQEDALSPKPGGSLAGCPLPYPDRFTEATAFIASREFPPHRCCHRRRPSACTDPPAAACLPPLLPSVVQMATRCQRSPNCCYTRCISRPPWCVPWWPPAAAPTLTSTRTRAACGAAMACLPLEWLMQQQGNAPIRLHNKHCSCGCWQQRPSAAAAPAGTALCASVLTAARYPALAGPLQRAQALGLVCGEQRKVAVVEAAGGHALRCVWQLWWGRIAAG